MSQPLTRYRSKRDFSETEEPRGSDTVARTRSKGELQFVIQKHAASHLHFDLRLELDGVMRSWAVPKGPSYDPAVKRLAMEVEDHPIEYNTFEGTIPKGQYGGGTVMLWDRGTYTPEEMQSGDKANDAVRRALDSGKLSFLFHGERLRGAWTLVRTRNSGAGERSQWILFKQQDDDARPGTDIVAEEMTSVDSGRTMEEIASGKAGVWHSNRASEEMAPLLESFADESIEPMSPSSSEDELDSGWWSIEPQVDGVRVLALLANGVARLVAMDRDTPFDTRAEPVAALCSELESIASDRPGALVLDGFIVEQSTEGAVLVAVDLLVDDKALLLEEPYLERRRRLEDVVSDVDTPSIELVPMVVVASNELAMAKEALGEQDVIAKRIDAPYEAGASDYWRIPSDEQPDIDTSAALDTGRSSNARSSRATSRASHEVDASVVIPNDRATATLHDEGREIVLTNLKKPFWPELGTTKGDLLQFYATMSPWLVPHLVDRAMVMKRYPHGAGGEFFFMKRAPEPRPAYIETCAITHASKSVINFPMIQNLASLLWVINLGCIDLNPWYSRCDDVDRPDFLHFDLDPAPDASFGKVRETALALRELLDELALPSYPKTSGSKGIHVYIPIARGPLQKEVWTIAKAIAVEMEARHPKLVTAEYRIANRPAGRVLVDYNQNAWGRTLASVYSVRPRAMATVSTPVTWEEIAREVEIESFTIDSVPERVRTLGDLWEPVRADEGRVQLEQML